MERRNLLVKKKRKNGNLFIFFKPFKENMSIVHTFIIKLLYNFVEEKDRNIF